MFDRWTADHHRTMSIFSRRHVAKRPSLYMVLLLISSFWMISLMLQYSRPDNAKSSKDVTTPKTTKVISQREENFLKAHKFALNLFPPTELRNTPRDPFDFKVMVITYLSPGFDKYGTKSTYTFVFSSMLYGSWKFVTTRYDWTSDPKIAGKVDLFVYYDEKIDNSKLPRDCIDLLDPGEIKDDGNSRCFRRLVPTTSHSYFYMEGFAFLQDTQLESIVAKYDYILRTDPDCFLTPRFFQMRIEPTREIIFSEWSYINSFSDRMLAKLADELGYNRPSDISSVGSTWLVRKDKFLELCYKTVYTTMYIFNTGWNATRRPEVAELVKVNPNGKWPEWWRYVSLLYGADLAVQDSIEDLNQRLNQPSNALDVNSHHSQITIGEAYHIHAIHGSGGVFDKFKFFGQMREFCVQGKVSRNFTNLLFSHQNYSPGPDPLPPYMAVTEYSAMIAVRGALDYMTQNGCYKNLSSPW